MLNIHDYEKLFFEVIDDLKEYLEELIIVGGWLAYLYSKFLWKNLTIDPITTVDIDFGLTGDSDKVYQQNIFQVLSSLDYEQHHTQLGKLYPVVFYKKGKVPIEFIADSEIDKKNYKNILGSKINVDRIDKFNFLIQNIFLLQVKDGASGNKYILKCPKPSAFLYHKSSIFMDRADKTKQAKDLYYMYFILRYADSLDAILNEVHQYFNKGNFINEFQSIKKYFVNKTSPGCLMVEKENGTDEFIADLRSDIYNRFNQLMECIK